MRGDRARDAGIAAIAIAIAAAILAAIGDRPATALFALTVLAWSALAFTTRARRIAWLPIASLALALASAEGFLEVREALADGGSELRFEPSWGNIESPHPLGYRAIAATETRAIRARAGEIAYDVTYTIGPDRLRVVPGSHERASGTIAFFGCSYSFGEGLEDEETLPSRFAEVVRRPVRNYAMHGWGPQQALRLIELGEVAAPLAGAIYVLIPDHVERVTGEAYWLAHGPRYVLDDRAEARHVGRFVDPGDPIGLGLARSQLVRHVRALARDDARSVVLLAAVLARARDLLRRSLGAELVILFWPEHDPRAGAIRAALHARALRILEAPDLLGADPSEPRFRIEGDPAHPNAEAIAAIARGLARDAPFDR